MTSPRHSRWIAQSVRLAEASGFTWCPQCGENAPVKVQLTNHGSTQRWCALGKVVEGRCPLCRENLTHTQVVRAGDSEE